MFNRLSVPGHKGTLLWASGDAARLGAWRATRPERGRAFTLEATVLWFDSYRVKQEPLYFTAPRTSKPAGLWLFPVIPNSLRIDGHTITAQLGPPEG